MTQPGSSQTRTINPRDQTGLVGEDQAFGIEVELAVEPLFPALQDVGAVLLGGVRWRVRCRSKNRHNVPINALRAAIAGMGADAVIPSNRCRWVAIPHYADTYKHRNRIERCFSKIKHFRRFATRYDRRAIHYIGFVHLAAAVIWLR